jgi:hypothetical protein
MFDANLYLLAKDHEREINASVIGGREGRDLNRLVEETRRRRVAAARRLLSGALRRD